MSGSGIVAALTVLVLSGCGRSEMGDYRPVDKAAPPSGKLASTLGTQPPSATDGNIAAGIKAAAGATSAGDSLDLPVSALAPVNVVDGTRVAGLLKVAPGESAAPAPATGVQPVSATSPNAVTPRTAELLIPEKTFQRDAASKALRVSFDDLDLLKVLNLEPVTENGVALMPAWLKGLNGQRVRLRGFMYPTFEAEGIERFVLARDNQICCFGRDPKVYDLVQVDMRNGKSTDYIPATRAFDVIGRFKIDVESEDGKPYGLYHIEDAEIVDR
jgi:hypothetical protein